MKRSKKIVVSIDITLIVLVAAIVWGCVWITRPERLTPIVNKVFADQMPQMQISVGKVDLTLWTTFPRLTLTMDSLSVRNENFEVSDGQQLLSVRQLSGGIDLVALLRGRIALNDVALNALKLNIVALNDSVANYTPLLTSDSDSDEAPKLIPDISINRFDIVDSLRCDYRQLADTLTFAAVIKPGVLLEHNPGGYYVDLHSNFSITPLLPLTLINAQFDCNGKINWSPTLPYRIGLNDFDLNLCGIKVNLDTSVDMENVTRIESGEIKVGPVAFDDVKQIIDSNTFPVVKMVKSDMTVELTARLTKQYTFLPDTVMLPSLYGSVEIADCYVGFGELNLQNCRLSGTFDIDGDNPDKSTLTLTKFTARGQAASWAFKGSVTDLFGDPAVNGSMNVKLDLARLSGKLFKSQNVAATGRVALDADGRFRMSDLARDRFYRIDLNGSLKLQNINVALPDSGPVVNIASAKLGLGTHRSLQGTEQHVDSLLMASVSIDTISVAMDDVLYTAARIEGGIGCENKPLTRDTTAIIPLGAGLRVASLSVMLPDTTRLRMRNASIVAKIQRYEDDSHSPLMTLQAAAGIIVATDTRNFVGLRDSNVDIKAHLRKSKYRTDSTRRRRQNVDTAGTMEFVDKGIVELINRWNMTGNVKAKGGMMFATFMPMRNRISDLDLDFSTDSVVLNTLNYKGGRSDFAVHGVIGNIRRAVNRRGNLTVRCDIKSDTLDVDQLLAVAAKGSEVVAPQGLVAADLSELEQVTVTVNDATPMSAILIPTNIDADIDVAAKTVMYSQMTVHGFTGCLMAKGGALNLTNLQGASDIGSVKLSALYSAPAANDIRFGMGLELKRIDVKRFVELMPAVDSVMPLLSSFKGIINADIAATCSLDSLMNLELPTLDAAVKLSGDSLTLLDAETFRTLKKWLRFKGNETNQINHMDVEMLIANSRMEIFPFVFDFDRYRLAVMGSNDLDLNFKYHVSVLKSPLPFKFGINLSGNADKMKVRLGGAKFKSGMEGQSVALVDTTRVNLLNEMSRVFHSQREKRLGKLRVNRVLVTDTAEMSLTYNDSIMLIKEGLLEAPDTVNGTIVKTIN